MFVITNGGARCQCAWRAIAEVEQRSQRSDIRRVTKDVLPRLLRASKDTLSRWSWLYLQSLAPTNPQWVSVVGCSSFSLCVNHKEGLCSNSGDINRLTMIANCYQSYLHLLFCMSI
jgi:hypothetical protein